MNQPAKTCEYYPDLLTKLRQQDLDSTPLDRLGQIVNENQAKARLVFVTEHLLHPFGLPNNTTYAQTLFQLKNGVIDDQAHLDVSPRGVDAADDENRLFLMSVLGILQADSYTDPSLGTQGIDAVVRDGHAAQPRKIVVAGRLVPEPRRLVPLHATSGG